jgi:hypothetical protein
MEAVHGKPDRFCQVLLSCHHPIAASRLNSDPQGAEASQGTENMGVIRQLSLVKGDDRFVFRYQTGQEAEVIDAFASLANNPASEFDWFDAAVLSYQMGRRLETELDQIAV